MTRRNWFLVLVVMLLLVAGLWAVGLTRTSSPAPVVSTGISVIPSAAPESVVTAKGSIVPTRIARLAFATSGLVTKLQVKEGDHVQTGDPLVQLDTSDLEIKLQAAQDSVTLATAMLAQAQTVATPDEISAAEANLRNAQAQYDRAKNGPSDADLEILRVTLTKTSAALQAAQAAYDRIGGKNNPSIGMQPESLSLQQATLDYQIAKANLDSKSKIDPAAVAAAEAAVYTARAALDAKKKGPRAEDLAVAQARVLQAKTALAQAKTALAQATLTAPFGGTVTSIATRPGEMATNGTPALTMADLADLHVETTDLDEWGASHIKIGQPIKATVNAFASKALTGKVASIASQPITLTTGAISYVVTIDIDHPDPDLRWGMMVKVEFQKTPVTSSQ